MIVKRLGLGYVGRDSFFLFAKITGTVMENKINLEVLL